MLDKEKAKKSGTEEGNADEGLRKVREDEEER